MKSVLIFATLSVAASCALAQNAPGRLYLIAKSEVKSHPVAQAELPTDMKASSHPKGEVADAAAKGAIKQAKIFFVSPKDGAVVAKKFKVKMGVEGIKIRPAGEAPDEVTSGHHHIIVDGAAIPAGIPIPTDDKHLHFGKGETETELTLPPGEHTLTLQFADGAHRSFGEKMSATIKVTVK